MRLRPKRFAASVAVKTDATAPRPVTLTCGPALQFDLNLREAHALAVALANALETIQSQQRFTTPERNHTHDRNHPHTAS